MYYSEESILLAGDSSFPNLSQPSELDVLLGRLLEVNFIESFNYILQGNAEAAFQIIKAKLNYKLNDSATLYQLLARRDAQHIVAELNQAIKNHLDLQQYVNFLNDLQECRELLRYFSNINGQACGPERIIRLDRPELKRYQKNAARLLDLIKNIHCGEMVSFVFPVHRQDHLNLMPTESTVYIDEGRDYRVVRRTILQRSLSYIKYNPKKLFIGGSLGAFISGVALFFLWPVLIPTLITAIAITCFVAVATFVGAGLTALFHLLTSENSRDAVSSTIRVTVERAAVATPENYQSSHLMEMQELPSQESKNQHRQLLNFMAMLKIDTKIPRPSLFKCSNSQLVDLIKTNVALLRLPVGNPPDLVRDYYKGEHFDGDIDFVAVKKVCEENRFRIENFLKIQSFADNVQENRLSKVKSLLNKIGCTQVSPENVAFVYWQYLKRNQKQDARFVLSLFLKVYPEQENDLKILFTQMKSSLTIFTNVIVKNKITFPDKIIGSGIIKSFGEVTSSKSIEQCMHICGELDFAFPSKIFDPIFMKAFLICDVQNPIDYHALKQKNDSEQQPTETAMMHAMQLFLRLSRKPTIPLHTSRQNQVNHFCDILRHMDFEVIVKVMSDIRHCTFVHYDHVWLRNLVCNFLLIEQGEVVRDNLIFELDKNFHTESYVQSEIEPFLDKVCSIISRSGKLDPCINLYKLPPSKLMSEFYGILSALKISRLRELYVELSSFGQEGVKQNHLILQLIDLYFEFTDKDKLVMIQSALPHSTPCSPLARQNQVPTITNSLLSKGDTPSVSV